MRGFEVKRKAGWDTHGLPVELEVEKQLGIKSKKEIEEYGIAKFNEECKKNVWKYLNEWQDFTRRIGFWVDMENPYITYSSGYMESLWAIIKIVNDKKLLYKDYKVVPWCPRCGTGLSSHELAQGYETIKSLSVFVKFRVSGQDPSASSEQGSTFVLAWTTTPWTLPGNVALAVGEKIKYVKVKVENEFFWLAKERKEFLLPEAEILEECLGKDLVGTRYEPVFPFLKDHLKAQDFEPKTLDRAFKVYSADFVTTEDGTGVVHTAVMYGQDDFELGTKENLPKFHLVDDSGHFIPNTGEFSGKFVHDEDTAVLVIKDLAGRNLLFKKEKFEHSYPFCWRCKTPLIYYARSSWYIRMSKLKDELVSQNKKINWEPEHIRDGRFGEWLSDVKDWAFSRERYWGTPLPVWTDENNSEIKVIGSVDELKKLSKKSGNRYFIARHGEADHNLSDKISYSDENKIHLTKKGEQESKDIANKLKKEKITKIFSSPFTRTRETVEIISKDLEFPKENIVFDSRIGELNPGVFEGQTWTERNEWVQTQSEDNYYHTAPEKGESHLDAKRRFGDFIYEIDSKYKNENILIVTHGVGLEVLPAVAEGAGRKRSYEIYLNTSRKTGQVFQLDFSPIPHNGDYELDLHRPYIDEIVLEVNGKELRRVPEVVDVWFDSGAMSLSQNASEVALNQKELKKRMDESPYPADFISEAVDQTRGWFYTLHAIGVLSGKGRAFKNVICLGHILDEKGQKMSKSKGNAVDSWKLIDKYGVDPLRLWMYSVNQPGEAKIFDEKTVDDVNKKIFNLFNNVLSFYELYSDKPAPKDRPKVSNVLDIWILALLDDLLLKVSKNMDSYKIFESVRSIRDFISDLSQWYLRRSRDRFKGEDEKDKEDAVATLGFVIKEFSKTVAPFAPFWAEDIYRRITKNGEMLSVHLEDWPTPQKVNEKVLIEMSETRRIVSLSLEARAKSLIKIRQPLRELIIKKDENALDKNFLEIIKDEVNVKSVVYSDEVSSEVLLDTEITKELREEGEIREFIRALQEMRKNKKLLPEDRVNVSLKISSKMKDAFDKNSSMIKKICGVSQFQFGEILPDENENWFEIEIV